MIKGITFAISACFIWGLIFVVPQFMTGFTSIEIAIGRYLFFGLFSACIFFKSSIQGKCRFSWDIWLKAIGYSLTITFGYYTFVVLALRYSTPAVCALILGISPITIAFYGNLRQKEVSFQSLLIPSILILIGLAFVNIPHFGASETQSSYLLGLLYCLIALSSWSWYVVANSKFLKQNPHINSSDWSTLIGVSTLVWVFFFTLFFSLFFEDQFKLDKFLTYNEDLKMFLIGSAILGILCAWVGGYLWNKATLRLPVSLVGQMMVFETIFGVIFVYLIDQSIPSALESMGILILMSAILLGLRSFSKRSISLVNG